MQRGLYYKEGSTTKRAIVYGDGEEQCKEEQCKEGSTTKRALLQRGVKSECMKS